MKKRIEYDKLVKDLHWPNISEKKQQEMIDIKMKLNVRRARNSVKEFDSRKNTSMLNDGKNINNPNSDILPTNKSHISSYHRYKPKRKNISNKIKHERANINQSQRIGTTFKTEKKPKDYLRELRTRREEYDDPELYMNPFYDWRSVSKTSKFDKATKMRIIKDKSKYIDEQINMKENSLGYNNDPMLDARTLNKMIIDSIEAKLALLNGFSHS